MLAALAAAGCGGFNPKPSSSLTISPKVAAVARDTVQNFTFTISTSGNPAVRWIVNGGSITQAGNFRSPAFDGVFDVRVESVENPALFAESVIAVGDSNSGNLAPADLKLGVGETVALSASFIDVTDEACDFIVSAGKATPTGIKTATFQAPETPGTLVVIARNRQNKAIFGKQTVEVRTIDVSVSPSGLAVAPGATVNFTAKVDGARNTGVTWSASAGAITAAGAWTAPLAPGEYTVTATSTANSKFTGQAVLFVR